MAQIRARHIPYKGTAPAITDIINGQIAYTIETVAATVAHVKAGRLKAYGVSTARRSGALPEVPTLAEAGGLPDFDAAAWIGFAAPAGTPREVVQRVSSEMQKILQSPDMKERLVTLGLDPMSSTSEEMAVFMRREQERYATIIRSANIKIDAQ
jgi:tripartite-type tricarboxylate transporter receptor subunit TctC